MLNIWKRVSACVLAAALMIPASAIAAHSDEEEEPTTEIETDGEASEETDDVSEESNSDAMTAEEIAKAAPKEEKQEEIEITAAQVQQYMTKLNTCEGITFYLRPEDYKDTITEEDAVDLLKHIELAGIDDATGEVVCTLEEEDDTDAFVVFLSEEGRWLVYTDPDYKSVTMVRRIVSLLDSEYLFLSMDGKTLELYNDDFDEVVRTYQKEGAAAADGSILFSNEDGWNVELNADCNQVLYSARFVTENDNLAMYVDDDRAVIGLLDKKNGTMWWSTPEGAAHDGVASNTIISDLKSSLTMVYGEPANRSTTNMRSDSDAKVKVSDVRNGVKITYDFTKAGIVIPVSYTLQDTYLLAEIETADIEEKDSSSSGKIATSVSVMSNFGAADDQAEGYFVIPDGSGALIQFNNGKTTVKSYSQPVYGNDITAVPLEQSAVTEQVYFPMYGIVNGDNGMLVVCTDGDSNATLRSSVSGQSNSSYNTCNFSFTLRDSDSYYMSGDNTTALTVFESGGIKTDKISLRYYPLEADENGMDYTDVAKAYRNYLLEEQAVTATAQADDAALYLDLYGGVEKTVSILGIPVTKKTELTSFRSAQSILSDLNAQGVDDIVVNYRNWTNAGISGKVDYKAKAAGVLGGKGDFQELMDYTKENGFTLYPAINNKTFVSGQGYYKFNSTAIRISGSYSRVLFYDLAYGTQSGTKDPVSLLSPSTFEEIYADAADRYGNAGLSAISLGDMTSSLYGDYGKKAISRDTAMGILENSYNTLEQAGQEILADTANAYALPYVGRITDVPMQSSAFDVFDQDIPFYQMVLHGVIPYAATSVNGSANTNDLLLRSLATGSNLHFDMMQAETAELKDTSLDTLYYANAEHWIGTAAKQYQLAKEVLSKVSDATITGYEQDGDIITTTYSNGVVTKVDLAAETIQADGTTYVLADYTDEGSWTGE